jgi:hypothetical protein
MVDMLLTELITVLQQGPPDPFWNRRGDAICFAYFHRDYLQDSILLDMFLNHVIIVL